MFQVHYNPNFDMDLNKLKLNENRGESYSSVGDNECSNNLAWRVGIEMGWGECRERGEQWYHMACWSWERLRRTDLREGSRVIRKVSTQVWHRNDDLVTCVTGWSGGRWVVCLRPVVMAVWLRTAVRSELGASTFGCVLVAAAIHHSVSLCHRVWNFLVPKLFPCF